MAKFPTFPTLYDNANQINIKELKCWNYLKPHQITNGVITCSTNNIKIVDVSIIVNTKDKQPFIELSYFYNDKSIKYKILLRAVNSNLGKGQYYYFVCPATKKQARKLYFIGGYFLHRTAFNGCMYAKQTESKFMRYFDKHYGCMYKVDEVYNEIYKPYFKKFYNGKPTKKYLKILQCIEKEANINYKSFERMITK